MAVGRFALLIGALAVTMAAQPVRAQDGPATYAEEIAQLQTQCEGGQLLVFAEPDRSTDFNGDGVNDILSHGAASVGCLPGDPAEGGHYGSLGCPAAGCALTLYLSGPRGHRWAWTSGFLESWRIEGGARPRIRVIDVYGCTGDGATRCEFAIQWTGRRIEQRRLRLWVTERDGLPPPLSPPWRVGTTEDGTRVASVLTLAPGQGVSALNLRCEGGAALLTLFPDHRALRLGTVAIEADGRRAMFSPRQSRDGTWSTPLGADAIGLLAGRASQARLVAAGRPLGTIPLGGSTRALGEALRGCWHPGGSRTGATPAPAATNGGPAASPPAVSDEAQIRAIVARIYDVFAGEAGDGRGSAGGLRTLYTPGLAALERAAGPGSITGYEAFCGCEDYQGASHVIRSVAVNGTAARADVEFTNFGELRRFTLDLVRTPGGWRVDDVVGARGSYRASLRPVARRRR